VLAVVRKRLIVENRGALLTQTHDQLDGGGITDITSLVNSVSKGDLGAILRQIKDSPECDGKVIAISSLPILPDSQGTDDMEVDA
jgi:hypothetical protein